VDQHIKSPCCGDIWLCSLADNKNSVQSGFRPVFIVSNNKNNTYSTTLNVIPITSKMNKRRLPVHVELWDYAKYGLQKPSTMMIEQISTISVEALDRRIGSVSDSETLSRIGRAMMVQFPVFDPVITNYEKN